MDRLDQDSIMERLAPREGWALSGDAIQRTYSFEDFVEAMAFVNAVSSLAEEAGHHPDILIRWNKVTLTSTTHDAGGLTEADFNLATQVDQAATR